MKICFFTVSTTQRLRREVTAVSHQQTYKSFGVGHNSSSSKKHDMPKKSLLCDMVIVTIDEVKNSDASTDVNDSIEDVNDLLVTASATVAVDSLDLRSAEIADR